MNDEKLQAILNLITSVAFLVIGVAIVGTVLYDRNKAEDDAYVLTHPDRITAQWQYQQLKMSHCAWCGRTVNMNRHHVIPQAANPALRDVRENLVVLCRDCHFVLGHRCNWKQYNPDVLYICTHYTNCVKSVETRREVDGTVEHVPAPDYANGWNPYPGKDILNATTQDVQKILHVTNDVPEKQRAALERILTWNPSSTNNAPFRPSASR